jgi:hypothetical protein
MLHMGEDGAGHRASAVQMARALDALEQPIRHPLLSVGAVMIMHL